jgi:plastocyanin
MFIRLNVILLAVTCFAACGGSSSSPSPTPQPAPAGSTSVTIPSGASFLTTTAFGANPLTIAAGTTISWLNNDNTTHTTSADGNAWNSGNIAPGARFNFVFQTAGQFTYHCQIHPGMTGTIVVQ